MGQTQLKQLNTHTHTEELDLANENTGHLNKFEFQRTTIIFSTRMSYTMLGDIVILKHVFVYLKFKFNWKPSILSKKAETFV